MLSNNNLKSQFQQHGGLMRTFELNKRGLSSRQIARLVDEGILIRIKHGVYQYSDMEVSEEAMISKLFPTAIIYLESALFYYGYSDRIPFRWQLAVDKNISKPQFNISYPPVTPFYIEGKYLKLGMTTVNINGTDIRIYDRDRTICDVIRYSTKLDRETFNMAIQRYVKDSKRDVNKLLNYAGKLGVTNKIKTYVGVWL